MAYLTAGVVLAPKYAVKVPWTFRLLGGFDSARGGFSSSLDVDSDEVSPGETSNKWHSSSSSADSSAVLFEDVIGAFLKCHWDENS